MISDRQLERAYQEKLDAYSRVNENDDLHCQYCDDLLDDKQQCDHDSIHQHQSCLDCCQAFNPEDYNPHTGELMRRPDY